MKRFLNKDYTKDFINKNYKSVSDFCKEIKISRSHFDGMLKGKISCGEKTIEKLKKLNIDDVEDFLEPIPILIGDKKINEILITDKHNNLIVSINSKNEISDKGFNVEYIYFN